MSNAHRIDNKERFNPPLNNEQLAVYRDIRLEEWDEYAELTKLVHNVIIRSNAIDNFVIRIIFKGSRFVDINVGLDLKITDTAQTFIGTLFDNPFTVFNKLYEISQPL